MTVLFFGIGTVVGGQAATQTPKIYPDDIGVFRDMESLQNSYQKLLYTDSNVEQEERLLRRVQQHPVKDTLARFMQPEDLDTLFEEYDAQEIVAAFCRLDIPGDAEDELRVSYDKFFTKDRQVLISESLRGLCQQENDLLRMQNDLARKNSKQMIFANSRPDDAPFDIIQDLDEIDLILFGEKAVNREPRPSFAYPHGYYADNAKDQTEFGPETAEQIFREGEAEIWQDEREQPSSDTEAFLNARDDSANCSVVYGGDLTAYFGRIGMGVGNTEEDRKSLAGKVFENKNKADYCPEDISFTGNLAGLHDPLTELNGRSEAAQCTSSQAGEVPFLHRLESGKVRHLPSDVLPMFYLHRPSYPYDQVLPESLLAIAEGENSDEYKEQPGLGFEDIQRRVISESDCSDVTHFRPGEGEDSAKGFRDVRTCQESRLQYEQGRRDELEYNSDVERERLAWDSYSTVLNAWNVDTEAVYSAVKNLRETFDYLQAKPKRQ